jgi:hypothetical protein
MQLVPCIRRRSRSFQEEGGYEEAAYHPGALGQQQAHTEEGLLYQYGYAENSEGNAYGSILGLCGSRSGNEPCGLLTSGLPSSKGPFSRALCVGSIMAAICGKTGDERYRVYNPDDDTPIEQRFVGKSADKDDEFCACGEEPSGDPDSYDTVGDGDFLG